MNDLKIGDVVVRKSYGGDTYFRIADVIYRQNSNPIYILQGITHRLEADSDGSDLVRRNPDEVYREVRLRFAQAKKRAAGKRLFAGILKYFRFKAEPGRILHIDSSEDFLQMCMKFYNNNNLRYTGKLISERRQPLYIRRLLKQVRPDILVVTGHDGIKKDSGNIYSMDSYKNSRYYVQSVLEARKQEPDPDKLCIFAGACQSYFEALMDAGANFASSPARVFIDALDPALVSEKIAITDREMFVSPGDIARITSHGADGIGGVPTRGRLKKSN